MITISAFKWVPYFAPVPSARSAAAVALEEAGLPYKTPSWSMAINEQARLSLFAAVPGRCRSSRRRPRPVRIRPSCLYIAANGARRSCQRSGARARATQWLIAAHYDRPFVMNVALIDIFYVTRMGEAAPSPAVAFVQKACPRIATRSRQSLLDGEPLHAPRR